MAMYCPRWQVEDIWGGISCLSIIAEDLYCNVQDLSSSLSFLIAVVACVTGVEHGHGLNDVGSVDCHSLYLLQGGLIW
jgi:hypothetical protein